MEIALFVLAILIILVLIVGIGLFIADNNAFVVSPTWVGPTLTVLFLGLVIAICVCCIVQFGGWAVGNLS